MYNRIPEFRTEASRKYGLFPTGVALSEPIVHQPQPQVKYPCQAETPRHVFTRHARTPKSTSSNRPSSVPDHTPKETREPAVCKKAKYKEQKTPDSIRNYQK